MIYVAVVLAAVCPAPTQPLLLADANLQTRNKAVVRRVFDEIFNQGKLEVADEIYARDFKNRGLHRDADLEDDQAAVRAERTAFPDITMTVDQMVAEGDRVAVLWTVRGTHTHAGYGGIPPTGARLEMRGTSFWRLADGRMIEEWTTFNQLGAYLQMARHLKWTLVGFVVLAVAVLIAAERLVWHFAKKAWFAWSRT
jgi:steroid delta-isomerase-like uncharacterized protein